MKLRRIVLIVALVSSMFICQNIFAYQFENYRWGQSLQEIKKELKNKNIVTRVFKGGTEGDTYIYSDKILGENCIVGLTFTPKNNLLAGIKVTWETTSVGYSLKEMLVKKYGKPYQPNQFMEKYLWSRSKYDALILEYSFLETTLIYFGESFCEQLLEESQSIAEQEMDKF